MKVIMVQSIDRAMSIIKLLASDNGEWWSISEIADSLILPVSTVHRLLNTLIQHQLVLQNADTKHYKLGSLWMEIGLRQLEKADYRTKAREVMAELAQQVEESIYFNIRDGMESIIIERVDSPTNVRIIDKIGLRIPLSIGAPNKTILANMPEEETQRIVKELLPSSKAKQSQLFDQLSLIKEQGYAVSYSERTDGTISVAAPVLDFNHQLVGAISIGVVQYRVSEERLSYLIHCIKKAAKEISTALGRT